MTVNLTSDSHLEDIGMTSNGEAINIDQGATLTVDTDPQWGPTGYYMGTLSINEGTMLIDGREIRILDYDGGSLSAAPSMGDICTGSTSSATGEVCYISSSSNGTSGTIKLKSLSGVFEDNETLTFTTPTGSALANGIGTTGSVTTANASGTTLIDSSATFKTDGVKIGDYILNTTDGSSALITNIDSETQLTCQSLSGGTDNDFDSSDSYEISADRRGWILYVGEESRDQDTQSLGNFTIRGDWYQLGFSDGTSSQTFNHYVTDLCPALWVETSAGSGVYELWLNAGDNWSSDIGPGELGKFFSMDNGTSTITFGDGTNGAIPPNGATIKVPNVHLACTNSSSWGTETRLINSGENVWPELSGRSGSTVDLDKCIFAGFYLISNGAKNISLQNAAFHRQITLNNIIDDLDLDFVGVGANETGNSVQEIPVTMAGCSGNVNDSAFSKSVAGSSGCISLNSCSNLNFKDTSFFILNRSSSTADIIDTTRGNNITYEDCLCSGGEINLIDDTNTTIKNLQLSNDTNGIVTTSNSINFFVMSNVSGLLIDGVSLSPNGTMCRLDVHTMNAVRDSDFRNYGTTSVPFDLDNQGDRFMDLVSYIINCRFARIYTLNSRNNSPIEGSSTTNKNLRFWNCYFGNDKQWNFDGGTNIEVRSVRASNGTLDTTDGIETDLVNSSGYHQFDMFSSTTEGMIGLVMTSKTSDSVSASSYTINSGTPVFDGSGNLLMRDSGDQITWEWQWDILGHTSFQNLAMVFQGSNQSNHDFEYDLDTGSGYSGSYTTINGSNLSSETISATGFRMRIRVTCNTTNTSNSISGLLMETNTTESDQNSNLHELDTVDVSIVGILSGSNYRIERISDNSLLASGTAGGDVSTEIAVSSGTQIRLIVGKDDYLRFTSTASASSSGTEFVVIQSPDNFRVADDTTALAYSGISVVGGSRTVTITSTTTHQQLYDYLKAWSIQTTNLQYDVPITTVDGITLNQTSLWSITVGSSGNLSSTTSDIDGTITVSSGGFYEGASNVKWESGGSVLQASHITLTLKEGVTPISGVEVAYLDNTDTNRLYNTSLLNDEVESNGSGIVEGYVVYQTDATPHTGHTLTARQYAYENVGVAQTIDGNPITQDILITPDGFITEATEATVASYSGIALDYTAKTITITSTGWTLDQIYDYINYHEALESNLDEDVAITTADGNTYNLATDWDLIISGTGNVTQISKTLAFSGTGSLTVSSGGFFEDSNGAIWESGGSVYNASHFWINVKDDSTNSNIQDAIVAFIETDTDTDQTYNTSLSQGGINTDSSGNAEGYVVWKIDSTTYSAHSQLVGEYDYLWSSIPSTITGSNIGLSSSYLGVRLNSDSFVSLSKSAALAITGITTSHSTSILDASDELYQNLYDNLKARQTRSNDIESGKSGYLSFYEEGLILSYDGSFYNLKSTWIIQNIAGGGTLKGGTVELGSPGDIDFDFNDLTIDYQTSGTYDHRNEIMDGTITLVNSSGGNVTVQLDTTVTYLNSGPNITVESSLAVNLVINSVDSNGSSTNFQTGSRLQLYNQSGASASNWASSTSYSIGDKILRTSGPGTEEGAGLWMECTTSGISGGTEPTWDTTLGNTTSDNTCVWTTRSIEIYNSQPGSVTSVSANYTYIANSTIRYRLIAVNGTTSHKWISGTGTATSTGMNISVTQESNDIYDTNGVDGSTVTECSISSNGIDIYIDDSDNQTNAQRIYNWYQNYLSSEPGIRDSNNYILATDVTHYVFDNTLQIRNIDTSNPLEITSANIVPVSGNSTDVFDLSNGASIALNFTRVEGFPYSSGSGLDPTQAQRLIDIESQTQENEKHIKNSQALILSRKDIISN